MSREIIKIKKAGYNQDEEHRVYPEDSDNLTEEELEEIKEQVEEYVTQGCGVEVGWAYEMTEEEKEGAKNLEEDIMSAFND